MRLLVFAYQAVGHACLERLLASRDEIACVVTHRDPPGETIWFPSVADLARGSGVPVRFAEDLEGAELGDLAAGIAPDCIYSFYYRNLLRPSVLRTARRGAYNLHGSLLPRYRGRAPVNWVILRRERETGVTLHHMVERADAGDIVGQTRIPIATRETARTLYAKIVPAAAELLERLHPLIREGRAPRTPQDEAQASTFGRRGPGDGEIDWSRSAGDIDALVRAVTHPFPGAFTWAGGRKLMVWASEPVEGSLPGPPGRIAGPAGPALRVACGAGALDIVTCGWEGHPEAGGAALSRALDPDGVLGRSGAPAGERRS